MSPGSSFVACAHTPALADSHLDAMGTNRWMHVHVGGALTSWSQRTRESGMFRRVLGGVSSSIAADTNRRSLLRVMRRFAQTVHNRRMAYESARTMVTRQLLAGWVAMLRHVAACELQSRAIRRLYHRCISRGWSSWLAQLASRRAKLTLVDTALYWRNGVLLKGAARALYFWRGGCDDRIKVARAATALRGLQRAERRAYNSWMIAWQLQRATLDTISTAAQIIFNRESARAMRTWQFASSLVARARVTCTRLRYAGALRALRTWRAQRALAQQQDRLHLWTARRFASDPSARLFDCWRRHAENFVALRHQVAAFLPRRRSLNAAWRVWLQEAAEKRKLRGVAAAWLLGQISTAMRTWRHHTARWTAARSCFGV